MSDVRKIDVTESRQHQLQRAERGRGRSIICFQWNQGQWTWTGFPPSRLLSTTLASFPLKRSHSIPPLILVSDAAEVNVGSVHVVYTLKGGFSLRIIAKRCFQYCH